MSEDFRFIASELQREIETKMARLGLLCRVFARGKTKDSLQKKIATGKYSLKGKKIQDCIGIRIVLYFIEDINIVESILKKEYTERSNSTQIDTPATNEFTVTRHNLIFEIPSFHNTTFKINTTNEPIDNTFEVQIRSMLSEGWHEVEHDLRYKCASHWEENEDLIRMLNGVLATLETSEWSMGKIFDSLAYRHYKGKNWAAMLHSKMKIRAAPTLNENISYFMDNNLDFSKSIFRLDRNLVITNFYHLTPRIPLTLDSIVYYWNFILIKNEHILDLTPSLLREAIENNINHLSEDYCIQ